MVHKVKRESQVLFIDFGEQSAYISTSPSIRRRVMNVTYS